MEPIENKIELKNFKNVLITDENANVTFYDVADLNVLKELRLKPEEIIGKNITVFYQDFTEHNSTILKTIASGEPLLNIEQNLITALGNKVVSVSSTFPIIKEGTVLGAIEFSNHHYTKKNIHSINKISNNKIYRKNNTTYTIDNLITNNTKLLEIKDRIHKISQTNSTVMLTGETGTGKEIVAQSIHNLSERYTSPFISFNCSAIPETLIESTLFGTVKGSFTGAEDMPGLFEQANNGTLFLDEINSLPIHLQVKLLKVIEDRQIRRIGGKKNINLNIRLISATNENPEVLIKENRLRIDLFYRLCIVQIDLPTLNERKEDIELLLWHYIDFYNDNMNIQITEVDSSVIKIFKKYNWPGNIRELRNAIETAYNNTSNSKISVEDIPQRISNILINQKEVNVYQSTEKISLKEKQDHFEKELLKESFERNDKSITATAKDLKISKQSLNYKLKKYKLK